MLQEAVEETFRGLHQLRLARRPNLSHAGLDSTAARGDFLVGLAEASKFVLLRSRAREDRVRVAVDKSGKGQKPQARSAYCLTFLSRFEDRKVSRAPHPLNMLSPDEDRPVLDNADIRHGRATARHGAASECRNLSNVFQEQHDAPQLRRSKPSFSHRATETQRKISVSLWLWPNRVAQITPVSPQRNRRRARIAMSSLTSALRVNSSIAR